MTICARVVSTLLAAVLSHQAAPVPDNGRLTGFSGEAAIAEHALEKRFDAALNADHLKEWMLSLTAHPHHVGSPQGKVNAEFIASLFESWGYDTRIETFDVLFPTPKKRVLTLLAPERASARLAEPVVEGDRTSRQVDERLPPYNAYSIDGDVRGELVYVNYGIPEDYEELDRRGISVEGKIVLARYGKSWRGIKPKVAAEHGAIGCILYSDPEGDGYTAGDMYPEGGYRPADGVQRGSVADMPLYPGDPLTPSVPAVDGVARLDRREARTLTKIPVLPVSFDDATPLLRHLDGPVAPGPWRGTLPLTYHIGPGPVRVRLEVAFDWKLHPARDVIATLPGTEQPDTWILRGNHHDAWVSGATDPVSGLVALLEEARVVGQLARENGWAPRRTIVYAAWDAEEPGLIGSTEWVEAHADLLRRTAAVYINTDTNSRGFLGAGGSHSLEIFFNEVIRDVPEPAKPMSVLARSLARARIDGTDAARELADEQEIVALQPLGSGSDFTPFLQHLGVASLNVGFGGEGDYGQYHSAYDSFDHYTRFMDPGFAYGLALARVTGRAVLRLAGADVLPFEFGRASDTINSYVDDLVDVTDRMRKDTLRENRRIDRGDYEAVSHPDRPVGPPASHAEVPYLNFAPLKNAAARLQESAGRYGKAMTALRLAGLDRMGHGARGRLERILLGTERALTRGDGLPGRPWYVHHIYAPGFYTGYGVKTIPGVREAVEQRKWKDANQQIGIAATVLDAFAAKIDEAAAVIEVATPHVP